MLILDLAKSQHGNEQEEDVSDNPFVISGPGNIDSCGIASQATTERQNRDDQTNSNNSFLAADSYQTSGTKQQQQEVTFSSSTNHELGPHLQQQQDSVEAIEALKQKNVTIEKRDRRDRPTKKTNRQVSSRIGQEYGNNISNSYIRMKRILNQILYVYLLFRF